MGPLPSLQEASRHAQLVIGYIVGYMKKGKATFWIICIVAILIAILIGVYLLVFSFGTQNAKSGSNLQIESNPEFFVVPQTSSERQISSFDAAIDGTDNIYVFWVDFDNMVRYTYKEAGGSSWSAIAQLPDRGKDVRILPANDGLHAIVVGVYSLGIHSVKHYLSKNQGKTWEPMPAIIESDNFIAECDATATNEAIYVACLMGEPSTEDVLELKMVRIDSNGISSISTVAGNVTKSGAIPPSIEFFGDELHVLWADNIGLTNTKSAMRYAKSADGGKTWTTSLDILSIKDGRKSVSDEVVQYQYIVSATVVATQKRIYALYASSAPWISFSSDGKDWPAPISVSPYSQGSWGDASIKMVSTPECDSVIWIDGRFEKRDINIGLPWSDADPSWHNNDILTACLPENIDGLLKDKLEWKRITPKFSYSDELKALQSGSKTYVFWSGVERVSKASKENLPEKISEEGSNIFYAVI